MNSSSPVAGSTLGWAATWVSRVPNTAHREPAGRQPSARQGEEDAAQPGPIFVGGPHDAGRLIHRLAEDGHQHLHDELLGRVVVVVDHHPVHGRFGGLIPNFRDRKSVV
jgi:hypothetical protein